MADAPGGGGGWSAAEVIVALVLGIGLITTLTGGTIKPIFDTPDTTKATNSTTKTAATGGCTISVSQPKTKEKVTNAVSVSGSFPECINATLIPDVINAQVVDSKGTPLSAYTALPVSKGFFGLGASSFSGIVPLSGVAQSTTGYLILTAPTNNGSQLTARVAIQFATGASTSNTTIISNPNNGSYFVPNPSGQQTTYTNTNTGTTTYTQTTTNTDTNTNTNTNTNTSSGGGTTF